MQHDLTNISDPNTPPSPSSFASKKKPNAGAAYKPSPLPSPPQPRRLPRPAAEIAAIYEDDQTDIVLTAFDQHILDTNGNMSIAVWRIKQQILAPGFQWGISNLQRIAREMGIT